MESITHRGYELEVREDGVYVMSAKSNLSSIDWPPTGPVGKAPGKVLLHDPFESVEAAKAWVDEQLAGRA